jgi:hypothetical protein
MISMQLAAVTPARTAAADALKKVPNLLAVSAGLAALGAQMSGEKTSRAAMSGIATQEMSTAEMASQLGDAVTGAVKVEPTLDAAALRQAAAGVVALVEANAKDSKQLDPGDAIVTVSTEMNSTFAPLVAAAKALDPAVYVPFDPRG